MFETGLILWIQSWAGPALDQFFMTITRLAMEDFFLAIIPIIYWTVDKGLGQRLAQITLFSIWANSGLKEFFHNPRPDPGSVRVLFPESGTGFGFPSGHAQNSAAFWGVIARWIRRPAGYLVSVLLILLVSFSRLYLGLHFPGDVLGGIAFGLVIVLVWEVLVKSAGRWADAVPDGIRMAAAGSVPLALALLYQGPDSAPSMGALAGLGIGAIIEKRWIGFSPRAAWPWQIAKILVGVPLVVATRFGLKAIFPDLFIFDFLRYAAIGLVAAVAVPWIFRRIPAEPMHPRTGILR